MKSIATLLCCLLVCAGLRAQVSSFEYFFDADPGQGNGLPVTTGFTPGSAVSFTLSIPMSGVAPGFHQLYLRARAASGQWSHYQSRLVYVTNIAAGNGDIASAEYFFDADPGVGLATPLGLTSGPLVNQSVVIPVTGLAPGFHQLYIRTKNTRGTWSQSQSRAVYIGTVSAGSGDIAGGEYFFDADPGAGYGTALALTAGSTIDQQVSIPVSGLSPGFHQLYLRVRNTANSWSAYQARPFAVAAIAGTATKIAGAEYFVDADPGVGAATAIPINPVMDSIDQTFTLSLPAGLTDGAHQLIIRVKNEQGQWSLYQATRFYNGRPRPGSGSALAFDGNDDEATATFSVAEPANTFTYEAWVNPTGTVSLYNPSTSGTAGSSGQRYLFHPAHGGGADAGFGLSVGTNGVQVFEHGDYYLPPLLSWDHAVNGWTHLAVVYSNKQPSLYVNGVLVATGLTSPRDHVYPYIDRAAMYGGGTYGHYQGGVDEVRIWSAALTTADIRDWMCKKLQPAHPHYNHLITAFNLDEGSGTTAFDGVHAATLELQNGTAYQVSGAPIGNVSAHSYAGAAAAVTLAHPSRGDALTATLTGGSADGIQLYGVTDTPNTKAGTACLGDNNGYFGVFAVNDTGATFQAAYNYTGLPMAGFNEAQSRLYARIDNSATDWADSNAVVDTAANTASVAGLGRSEYILSNAIVSPTITVSASPSVAVCPGTPVTFTTTTLNGGSAPAYQWRKNGTDIAGAIGAQYADSTLANGTLISCVLTSNSTCVSPASMESAPVAAAISAGLMASVSIASDAGTTICAGTQVNFTATPLNGGLAPVYQWKINGIATGGNAAVYTSSALHDGDVVTCTMNTSAPCAGPASVSSAPLTMQVMPVVVPTIAITSDRGTDICSGIPVQFSAATAYAGNAPTYQWKKNGQPVGTSSALYTDNALADQDVITCTLTSNAACAAPLVVTAADLTMRVGSSAPATVAISSNTGRTICAGASVTFTAAVTNGGATPSYQWKKNGVNTGANASTYADNGLADGDLITCDVVSSSACAMPAQASGNALAITVRPYSTPAITIAASPAGAVCAGTPVLFAATTISGGEAPAYQWLKNGQPVGSSNAAYTDAALASGDVITCRLTSSLACVTQPAALSNAVSVTILSLPVASAGPDQTILRGSSVALAGSGGGSYHWSTGDTTATIIAAPITTTAYSVEVTNAQGCKASDTAIVQVDFSALSIAPGSYDFGDVATGVSAEASIIVTNGGTLPETISSASVAAPFTTSVTTQAIAPGASVSIPVTFTPGAQLIYQQPLTVITGAGTFTAVMQGRGVHPVPAWTVNPAPYNFGNVAVGDSATHTFLVSNTGNVPLDVSNISSSNTVFTAGSAPGTIAIGGQAAFSVAMKPVAITAYSGQLSISSAAPGLVPLSVALSGKGYVPGALPVLQFVAAAPYSGQVGIDKQVGAAGAFTYRVQYRNLGNVPPMAGYPAVGIDANGDGDFLDAGEGIYPMSQLGSGTNWSGGEIYTFTQSLPLGSAYGYRFFADDSLGNTAVAISTGYQSGPLVTNQGLDLSIYANDITFSSSNPAVGQQFTVSAVVHNTSAYSASNVPVRFYKDSVFLASAVLPYIGPNTTATITHNFAFAPDGFYPIKVWIDSAQTLGENNPLNNYAIRPVIVGNFSVPGAILITSSAAAQSCPAPAVNISGTAVYSGLNLAGNPPVLGATVTVQITNGPALTTTTVAGGAWSVYYSGFGCGQPVGYTVTVTDYTLTSTSGSAAFTAPCQSCYFNPGGDYAVHATQSGPSGCVLENTPFNYSLSFLNPCGADTLRSDTTYVYADGVLAYMHARAVLDPCAQAAYTNAFSLPAGSHQLSNTHVYFDTAGRHEATQSLTVNVEPALPDLSLGNFAQTAPAAFEVRDWNNVCVAAGPHKIRLYDSLAGQSYLLLDSFAVASIAGQAYQQWSYANPALTMGYHYLKLVTDEANAVAERNETNNTLTAVLYVPFPELTISEARAAASNLQAGSSVNFSAKVRNSGSTAGAFKVQFYANGAAIGGATPVGGLGAGAEATVVSNLFIVPAGGCPVMIMAVADADGEVGELREDNNTDSMNLATDLTSGTACNGLGSSCNPYRVPRALSRHFVTSIHNGGTRDASVAAIRFSLGGQTIGSDVIAGVAAGSNASAGLDYTFNTAGGFVIQVDADTANTICEADETNNTGAIYVTVVDGLPDLEVLSQHISPSNLNPNPGQSITVVASVFNQGTQKSLPARVRFMVDNVQLGADIALDTLYPGRDTSVMATMTYASNTVGPKIIKVMADVLDENTELRENNNEATRAIIVGGAPDLARSRHEAITFTNPSFRKGQTVQIRNYIRNYGGDGGTAWLKYFITNEAGARTLLDSVQFTLASNDSALVATTWPVNMTGHGWVTTEIAHSNPQEFDEFNNTDSLAFVAGPELNIAALIAPDSICESSPLSIGYSISKDAQPVTFEWRHDGLSTGVTSAVAYSLSSASLADSGAYQLYATDSFGTEHSPEKSIAVRPVLMPAITATALPGNVICKGSWVKFRAAPVNGGSAPAYQWMKNGAPVPSASRAFFIDSLVNNGDAVSCTLVSNQFCTSAAPVSSNVIGMTVNGLGSSLAANQASQTADNDSGMYFNYTDNNCQLIATVSTDSLHDLGLTTATTNIDAQFYGFVQRSVEITPTINAPATVKLYFTQAEFDAYNNAAAPGLARLPAAPADAAVNNIVVYQYHGLPSAGTTGPGGRYDAANVSVIAAADIAKRWNAASGFWEISFPVHGFSGHYLKAESIVPLAIRLKDIGAANKGVLNEVHWETAQEAVGDYFELERSTDGKAFYRIARISANGRPSPYTFMDNEPVAGANYYRLKMVDGSQRYQYSSVVEAVAPQGVFALEVFPNPAHAQLQIDLHDAAAAGSLQLTDMTGQAIRSIPIGRGRATADISDLAPGLYLLRYTDAQHHQTVRITKE